MDIGSLIQPALDHGDEGYTVEDVQALINSGKAVLYNTERTAAVVQKLDVWLYGGELADLPELEGRLVNNAKNLGIEQIVFWGGRKGWGRVLKKHGYIEKTIMVKEIDL